MRSDAEVIAVAASEVSRAMGVSEIGPILIDQLAGEHIGLIRRYAARTTLSVRDRVVVFLHEEARRIGRLPCPISVGPADLADLVGADPSHVYRVLRDLRTARTIDFARGRIVVRSAVDVTPFDIATTA
jgi:CRP-like cAMP-binding protein